MRKYLNWICLWYILESVEYAEENIQISMISIIRMIQKPHINIEFRNNYIYLLQSYDYLDYRYSSSIIGSEDIDLRIQKKEKFIHALEEETNVLNWLVGSLNNSFDKYPEMYYEIFYDRYFNFKSVRYLKNKYTLSNNRYYCLIETAEYIVQKAWLLVKPSCQLQEILLSNKSCQIKIEKK